MKRNEKIELLNSIKNGTPIPIALKIIVLLFETIDNPNIYYDRFGYGVISINGIDAFKKYEKLIGWSSQKNLNKAKDWKNRYKELYLS